MRAYINVIAKGILDSPIITDIYFYNEEMAKYVLLSGIEVEFAPAENDDKTKKYATGRWKGVRIYVGETLGDLKNDNDKEEDFNSFASINQISEIVYILTSKGTIVEHIEGIWDDNDGAFAPEVEFQLDVNLTSTLRFGSGIDFIAGELVFDIPKEALRTFGETDKIKLV